MITLCLNSYPSSTASLISSYSFNIPHSFAMFKAVILLSPVTIRTFIPALLHFSTAGFASGLRGSCSAANPKNVSSLQKNSSGTFLILFSFT